MIKKGLAKDVKEAYKRLGIVSVALIAIAVVITVVFSGPTHAPIYQ